MGEIHYAPKALDDLDDIEAYISDELANPEAAQRTIAAILKRISFLGSFPFSGTPLSSVYPTSSAYRYVVSGNYLAFYRVEKHDVYVDRILYARREYIRILLGDIAEN